MTFFTQKPGQLLRRDWNEISAVHGQGKQKRLPRKLSEDPVWHSEVSGLRPIANPERSCNAVCKSTAFFFSPPPFHFSCAAFVPPLFMNVGAYLWPSPCERAFPVTKVTCHWEKGGPAMNWVSAIKYDFAPEWRANTFNRWNSLSPHNLSFLKYNNDFSREMRWFWGAEPLIWVVFKVINQV